MSEKKYLLSREQKKALRSADEISLEIVAAAEHQAHLDAGWIDPANPGPAIRRLVEDAREDWLREMGSQEKLEKVAREVENYAGACLTVLKYGGIPKDIRTSHKVAADILKALEIEPEAARTDGQVSTLKEDEQGEDLASKTASNMASEIRIISTDPTRQAELQSDRLDGWSAEGK